MHERPIRVTGAKQHNLKNITVSFPAKKISVITGVSGSGKSSLAFDTLYAEGQRRYIESLSTYTRQFLAKMPKPEVETIENLPPAIAIEQKNPVLNARSTVGTQTEIIDYLRVLYAKLGKIFCLKCHTEVKELQTEDLLQWSLKWFPHRKAVILAPLQFDKKTQGSLFQLLKEQGFQRVVVGARKEWKIYDLEETLPTLLSTQSLFVVIDRLKMSSDHLTDPDTQTRLFGSIEQALRVGKSEIAFLDLDSQDFQTFSQRLACSNCHTDYRHPEPELFSFNNPVGACPHCTGFGHTLELDEKLVVPDSKLCLAKGAIDPLSKPSFSEWQESLFRFADRHKISLKTPYESLTTAEKKLLWEGEAQKKGFPGIYGCFEQLKKKKYKLHVRVFIRRYQIQSLCPVCLGSRLRPEASAVKIEGKNIGEVLSFPISELLLWIRSLTTHSSFADVLSQIERRLTFLTEVGVGYLTLSRLTKTLSGGEYQRIQIASQLGSGLCGTLYVLDEPSIGLHPSDTKRLIHLIEELRDQGNTIVMVEHDLEVMKAADYLVEIGPEAGKKGGQLIASGSASQLISQPKSLTGAYLAKRAFVTREAPKRPPPKQFLSLEGCTEHNLKNLNVHFPLKRLVVITGVSGSGKTTLIHKTLYQNLAKLYYQAPVEPGRVRKIFGAELLNGVIVLDQSPIGKSSRSNPATYLKAWDEVRKIYAAQPLSQKRGYTAREFSFNTDGGRCPTCLGEGKIRMDMHFMAEVELPCDECQGMRFQKEILEIEFQNKNIFQLLETTIDEAYELLKDYSVLEKKLGHLRAVGLGYLQLGQSSSSLSGGESQRLKIASTLDTQSSSNLLYLFDEPTTGLHLKDIQRLMGVIHQLVDSGSSVMIIEHHLDVIRQADWIIDIGPHGGANGGELVGEGEPKDLASNPRSLTGSFLKSSL